MLEKTRLWHLSSSAPKSSNLYAHAVLAAPQHRFSFPVSRVVFWSGNCSWKTSMRKHIKLILTVGRLIPIYFYIIGFHSYPFFALIPSGRYRPLISTQKLHFKEKKKAYKTVSFNQFLAL